MQIQYQTGDLMKASEPLIVHGCNAQGVMGSGVAKLIRDKFPAAYRAYIDRSANSRPYVLGEVIWADCGSHVIANAITQKFYGRDGSLYADYNAIERAFQTIDQVALATQRKQSSETPPKLIDAVAMPLIGAGLAGGSWATISEIIERCSTNFQPVVYLIDGKIPTS